MIRFIALIVPILFYVYLIYTFTSAASLILNIVIITALYFLITKDLKDQDNHKYYIASLLLTAFFFIFSYTQFINYILNLTERLLFSLVTVTGLLVYLFAQLMGLIYEFYRHLKENKSNKN